MGNLTKTSVNIIVALLLVGCTAGTGLEKPASTKISNIAFTINKEEQNIMSSDGSILAKIYFERPILSGGSNSISAVNEYFDTEEEAFFLGAYHTEIFEGNRYQNFVESVERFIRYHEEDLVAMPLEYSVTSEVTYLDDQILSVKETVYWMAGGVSNEHYFGVSFDLNSGCPISIEDFVNKDIKSFNKEIIELLVNNGDFGQPQIEDEINNYTFSDYAFYYTGKEIILVFPGLPQKGIILSYPADGTAG